MLIEVSCSVSTASSNYYIYIIYIIICTSIDIINQRLLSPLSTSAGKPPQNLVRLASSECGPKEASSGGARSEHSKHTSKNSPTTEHIQAFAESTSAAQSASQRSLFSQRGDSSRFPTVAWYSVRAIRPVGLTSLRLVWPSCFSE